MSTGGAGGPARPGDDRPHDRSTDGDSREASTPWERPRRWAHDRSDATRVEDLVAKLSGSGLPPVSRRHRRFGDEAGEAVPAGDLIAALNGDADEPGPATEGTSTSEPAPAEPSVTATPAPECPPAPDRPPAATSAQPPDHSLAAPAAVDPSAVTALLPATVVTAAEPLTSDQPSPLEAGPMDESWQSVLASLRRQSGTEPAGAGRTPPPHGPGGRPPAHAGGPQHGWLIAGRSLVAMVAVLLLLATGTEWVIKARADAVLADRDVSAIVPDDTNISTPTVTPTGPGAAGGNQDPNADGTAKPFQAENILLMGSDTRASQADRKLGGGGTITMQSDVLMIAHLSADRSHVTVVSIPRDLWVTAPTCKAWDYQTNTLSDKDYVNQYSQWRITNAYSVGGPQCTVRAVQQLTGLRINRVIIIDFSGFKSMVDALGGITIDACRPIIDGNLGTVLASGGSQHINGTQALNLVRAREVRGDTESDLARIRRQQKVLSTLLRQATSAGVLLNPAKLNSLLQAFVHNVQTDNVTLDDLLNIAQSLGNLDPRRVTFYTLPTHAEGGGLQMTPAGPLIWNALVNDRPLPGEVTTPPVRISSSTGAPAGSTSSGSAPTFAPNPITSVLTSLVTSTPSAPQTISVQPDQVNLQVVNVAGRGGVATQAMNALTPLGFHLTEPDLLLIPGEVRDGVTVEYSAGNRAAAVTVAAAVPGATLVPTDGLGDRVRLMLGSSFDGTVRSVTVGNPVPAALSTTPSPVVSTVVTTRTVTPQAGSVATTTPTTTAETPASQAPVPQDGAATTLTSGQVAGLNAGNASCI